MSVREARDLVVHQAGREPRVDDVGVTYLAPPPFRPDHPDRAIGLDPGLDVFQPSQVGIILSAEEYEVYKVGGRLGPAGDDVRCSLAKERQKSSVVDVDDGDLGAGLDAKLVEQRPRARDVRAQLRSSSPLVPRTAPKTITPTSQPA